EIQGGVVGRDAKEHVAEGEEIGRVGVAVAIEVAEETEDVRRRTRWYGRSEDIVIAADPVAVAVERAVRVAHLTGGDRERVPAIRQRAEFGQGAVKRKRDVRRRIGHYGRGQTDGRIVRLPAKLKCERHGRREVDDLGEIDL